MNARWPWLSAALSLVLIPAALTAQSFEGVVRHRSIEVDEDVLAELLYPDDLEEPDFDDEADWLAWTAKRLFSVPVAGLVSDGSADVTETTTWVKGDRFRADVSGTGDGMYTIYDAGEMFLVQPAEQWYVRMSREEIDAATEAAMAEAEAMAAEMGVDLEEMRRMAEEMGSEEAYMEGMDAPAPRIRDLGDVRTVAGLRAVGREVVTSDEVVHAWCAEESPPFADALSEMIEQLGFQEEEEDDMGFGGPAAEDLACEDRMPMFVQSFVAWGGSMGAGIYSIDEVVAIERTSVDDAKFEIPAGFEERSLSDLWGVRGG